MKTIQVAEATNIQLDWLVAKALGYQLKIRNWQNITDTLDPVEDADTIASHKARNTIRVSAQQLPNSGWFPNKQYTTDWAQVGPMIEREKINLEWWHMPKEWHACMNERLQYDDKGEFIEGSDVHTSGPTPLIAAARCYCCAKLGDLVEVPEELCQQQSS